MKSSIFWDVTPYSLVKFHQHFGGVSQASSQQKARGSKYVHCFQFLFHCTRNSVVRSAFRPLLDDYWLDLTLMMEEVDSSETFLNF
jgi:hypothetical protein